MKEAITQIKNGTLKMGDFPAIRIFEKDGKLYTLDNRRLYVAQQAGVKVNYIWATEAEIKRESFKFTTINDGISIQVRG